MLGAWPHAIKIASAGDYGPALISAGAVIIVTVLSIVMTRVLNKHDERLSAMEKSAQKLDEKIDNLNIGVAVLVAGDTSRKEEIDLLRKRYHILANAMTAVKIKLNLQGIDVEDF